MIQEVSGKNDAILAISDLLVEVGVPTTLKELNISENSLDRLAETLVIEYPRARNPKEMTMEDARKIMRAMYG